MLQAFEKRDFSYGSRWDTVVLFFKADLFQCHGLPGNLIDSLIDHTIGALAELIELLVSVNL